MWLWMFDEKTNFIMKIEVSTLKILRLFHDFFLYFTWLIHRIILIEYFFSPSTTTKMFLTQSVSGFKNLYLKNYNIYRNMTEWNVRSTSGRTSSEKFLLHQKFRLEILGRVLANSFVLACLLRKISSKKTRLALQ